MPDYRGPVGAWTRRDRGLPPPPMPPWSQVEPNAGHRALVALQRAGRLAFLISQNVDGLHLASGIEPERLAEPHGNRTLLRCLGCDARPTLAEAGWERARWGDGYRTDPVREGQPACVPCGGRLISSVVNFGDVLPEREIDLAWEHAQRADLFAPAETHDLDFQRGGLLPVSAEKRQEVGWMAVNVGGSCRKSGRKGGR